LRYRVSGSYDIVNNRFLKLGSQMFCNFSYSIEFDINLLQEKWVCCGQYIKYDTVCRNCITWVLLNKQTQGLLFVKMTIFQTEAFWVVTPCILATGLPIMPPYHIFLNRMLESD